MVRKKKRGATLASVASKALSAGFLLNAKRMVSDLLDDLEDRIDQTKKRIARDLGVFFLAEIGALSVFIGIILFVKDRWGLEYWMSFMLVGVISLVIALLLKNHNQLRRR